MNLKSAYTDDLAAAGGQGGEGGEDGEEEEEEEETVVEDPDTLRNEQATLEIEKQAMLQNQVAYIRCLCFVRGLILIETRVRGYDP